MALIGADGVQDYSRHVVRKAEHGQAQDSEFGGPRQQDAEEFLSFLFENLQDETNGHRNKDGIAGAPQVQKDMELQAAYEYWVNHLQFSNSIIDKFFRGLEMRRTVCETCDNKTYAWEPFTVLKLHISSDRGSQTLTQCLREYSRTEMIEGYDCEVCKRKTKARRKAYLARLPSLLCIQLVRFAYRGGSNEKILNKITWNFQGLDLEDNVIPRQNRKLAPGVSDPGLAKPFDYQCYGVVTHMGATLAQGHYFAYVRNPQPSANIYDWYKCSDANVSRVRIGSGDMDDIQDKVFLDQDNHTPYMLFFKKKEESSVSMRT